VEGPACFVIALGIMLRWPSRYPLQLCVSLGQLYGVLLYFLTETFDKKGHIHPNRFYFWVYYVAMNLPWVVVPSLLIIQAWNRMLPAISDKLDVDAKKKEV
jgi:cholestenol delta-isomerase